MLSKTLDCADVDVLRRSRRNTPPARAKWDFNIYVSEIKELSMRIANQEGSRAFESLLLAAILDSVQSPVMAITPQGQIRHFNPACERLSGYAKVEIVGRSIWEAPLLASDADRVKAALATKEMEYVATWVARSGALEPIHWSYRVCSSSGEYLIGTGHAHHQAEVALKESEERYRSIYEQTPVMLHSIDSSGNIVSVSHYWLKKMGYEKSEVIGRKSTDFLTEDSRRYAAESVLPEYFRRGHCQDVPYQFVKKNGDVIDVLLSAIAERDRQGKIVRSLAVLTDVTERLRAEQELLRLNQKLIWSNQELEQYAYMASHDLREPLRKIRSYTELLFERYSDRFDAKADKYQRAITSGVTRMENLIGDLLLCSRVSRAELVLEPVNLNSVLEQVKDNLKVAIEESQAQILVEPLPTIAAHRSHMIQLFQNLIANSIKFRRAETPAITVKAKCQGKEWLVSVTDNGIGIAPQSAERVFAIFQRLHSRSQYDGTGIGLTICKKIVERHGGRIWFESAGEGTVFYFTFPFRQFSGSL